MSDAHLSISASQPVEPTHLMEHSGVGAFRSLPAAAEQTAQKAGSCMKEAVDQASKAVSDEPVGAKRHVEVQNSGAAQLPIAPEAYLAIAQAAAWSAQEWDKKERSGRDVEESKSEREEGLWDVHKPGNDR